MHLCIYCTFCASFNKLCSSCSLKFKPKFNRFTNHLIAERYCSGRSGNKQAPYWLNILHLTWMKNIYCARSKSYTNLPADEKLEPNRGIKQSVFSQNVRTILLSFNADELTKSTELIYVVMYCKKKQKQKTLWEETWSRTSLIKGREGWGVGR